MWTLNERCFNRFNGFVHTNTSLALLNAPRYKIRHNTMTAQPGVNQIRATLPEASLARSTLKGVLLFLFSATFYALTFAGCLWKGHPLIRALCVLVNSNFISILFIVGHDACHGSLTPSNRLNQILGRLAFLPSWHPFTSWDWGHNKLHHCWTNLRTKDYVWAPYSKEEFDRLPLHARLRERFYRSAGGVGHYYLMEIWWRHMMWPRPEDREKMPRLISNFDRAIVVAFILCQISVCVLLGWPSPWAIILNLTLGIVWPQLSWNWWMGVMVLLHHTHPKVRWYDNPSEWSYFTGQVQSTVHVEFPKPMGAFLHHIMEHTAHHVDPRIPLYNLPAAQRSLEQAYSEDVIRSPFSFGNFRHILSQCQLYDYRQHRWLAFDGKVTSAWPLIRHRLNG